MEVSGIHKRLLMCLVLLTSLPSSSYAENITCEVRPADGVKDIVTCDFPFDLRTRQQTFALFLNVTKENVVTCNILVDEVHCSSKDGFPNPRINGTTAIFSVPRNDTSSYFCDTIPHAGRVAEVCSTKMGTDLQSTPGTADKEGNTTEDETGLSALEVALCVIGSLAVPLVIVLVFLATRPDLRRRMKAGLRCQSKKANAKEPGEETENLQPKDNAVEDKEDGPSTIRKEGCDSTDPEKPPTWCKCGHCREMPTPVERICCEETPCLSTTTEFRANVLVPTEARTPKDEELLHDDIRETKRKYAYKRFVHWHKELVAKDVKTPVYSCCVWAVRKEYPSQDGKYTGFIKGPITACDTNWLEKMLNKSQSDINVQQESSSSSCT